MLKVEKEKSLYISLGILRQRKKRKRTVLRSELSSLKVPIKIHMNLPSWPFNQAWCYYWDSLGPTSKKIRRKRGGEHTLAYRNGNKTFP